MSDNNDQLQPEIPYTQNQLINANGTKAKLAEEKSVVDGDKKNGVLHEQLNEPVPSRAEAGCEIISQGKNNQFIIFGRDRINTRETGFGATPTPRAGAIEIVVGIGGARPKAKDILDPNPEHDAAKIYISQKSNIDQHFNIASGNNFPFSPSSTDASAIALKADAVRIIGRENIKIVTGTDLKNSNKKFRRGNPSITLIGGNDSRNIQPMVKGYNLAAMLDEMITDIEKLNGIVADFLQTQHGFNQAVVSHTHLSPFYSVNTSMSQEVAPAQNVLNEMITRIRTSLMTNRTNFRRIKNQYIDRFDNFASPILSDYNFLN